MKKLLFLSLLFFLALAIQAQNYYTVQVVQPPALVTNAGPDVSTCFYDSVQIGSLNLAVGGQPPYVYSWFPTYGLSDPTIPNPMALPDDTTTYTVTVTDSNNCTGWAQMVVNIDPCAGINKPTNNFEVLVYPNPSNDGVFNLTITGKRLYNEYYINVYSIYGKQIFYKHINAEDRTWNDVLDFRNILAKGIYILEINNKYIKNYQKIIIQ